MTKRLSLWAALYVQAAGAAAVIYGGFLIANFVGFALLGVALYLLGITLEREVE